MRTNSLPRRGALAALAATTVVLAACGSTTESQPTAATAAPVVVGTSGTTPASTTVVDRSIVTRRTVDAFVADWAQRHVELTATSGIAVAVIRDGGEPVTAAVGNAGVAGHPLTSDTWLHQGSLTKTYVATALLRLQEQGKVNLDKLVTAYVPNAPVAEGTTVRELLNLTAGLPDYIGTPTWSSAVTANPTRAWTLDEIMTLPPSAAPARGTYAYSNTDYIVAGQVLESVTKMTAASALRSVLFEPLHLTQTDTTGVGHPSSEGTILVTETSPPTPTTALGSYISMESTAGTAGSMSSTVSDLARFAHSLDTGAAMTAASWDEMRKYGAGGYGLGIADFAILTKDERVKLPAIGNNGEIPGFGATYLIFPDHTVIALMANDDRVNAVIEIRDLAQRLGLTT
jgi:D-alanyl-D-alanine carboxypeptidase